MNYCQLPRSTFILALLLAFATARAEPMRVYQTPYYVIHSDLSEDDAREAVIRMTRMFEEYRFRTQGFSGEIRQRLPFYLYRRKQDYLAAGGPTGSAGVFTGETLMAFTGDRITSRTWGVIQHEGFHQFAKAVIGGQLPVWLNEGLAEYFGEALFTGDSFVSGLVPPSRLARLKDELKKGRLKPIRSLLSMSHAEWNRKLAIENYDQSWSIVHFLVHGQDPRYPTSQFVKFISEIGHSVPWQKAWEECLGDASDLKQHWRDWAMGLPSDPTADKYTQAYAQTFASFLARAAMQKQRFDSFDDFLASANDRSVRTGLTIDDWLPARLLKETAERMEHSQAQWSLQRLASDRGRVVAICPDGVRIGVIYLIQGSRPPKITTDFDDTAIVIERARNLIASGNRDEARKILQQARNAHPNSPVIKDVQMLLRQTQ